MRFLQDINYRSVSDLNKAIVSNLASLGDADVIVGIPRSGLLAANLLALHLNVPVADLEGFVAGRVLAGGKRLRRETTSDWTGSKAIVIDDSVNTGAALREARRRITESTIKADVRYGCVFVTPEAKADVDFYCAVCPSPRVFEWNIMHHPILETACVDIDGVLCRDPTETENDDGPRYDEFICNTVPQVVPTVRIGYLVTCRLEKYRAATERWLSANRFDYGQLVMMNYPDKAARLQAGNHAAFKAEFYHRTNANLFVESSLSQAQEILRLTGKSVFCLETREMLAPGIAAKSRRVSLKMVPYLTRRLRSLYRRIAKK